MITISEEIKQIILRSPLLESGIAEGLINLSALARRIKPQLEKKMMRSISTSALLMALKRLTPRVIPKLSPREKLFESSGDLTVRSNLSEFTFSISPTLLERQKELLHRIKASQDRFVTFTQGVHETTIIINSPMEALVKEIFARETTVAHFTDLSAITIKLKPENVHTPGVHYAILKQLAWHGINIIESVSTFREFTIILKKDQVNLSFSVLISYLSRPGENSLNLTNLP
jgi:hypothetical protein